MTDKFVSGTYHPNIQVAELITDDGRRLLRAGGTLPWRINNCGDLSSPVTNGEPTPRFTKNFIGFARVPSEHTDDIYHFFIFPDYETGRLQLKASLKRKYGASTIPEAIKKYAPKGDNNPQAYADAVLKETGIAGDTKICDLTDAQVDDVTRAIQKVEGYDNVQVPRREVWVPVSTLVATDGARPLADEEIVLRVNGKDTVVKTNAVGQAPPVVHDKGPVEVLHKKPDGQLQSVGTVGGDKGGHYSFWKNFAVWTGLSAPDEPPESTKSRPQPLTYVVQPNDSLSKIAARFKTTVDKLKSDNRLKSNVIHPGERLGIFGTAPTTAGQKSAPRKLPATFSPASAAGAPASATAGQAATARKPLPAAAPAKAARSEGGAGKPLAVMQMEQGRVPWMAHVVAEAKQWKGMQEGELETHRNYHVLLNDGIKSLSGTQNAWCAAFVNWCLSQAGYPIDGRAWAAKARGIYSHDEVDGAKHFVQNPLFVEIPEPIYGAIVVVCTNKGDHGTHATTVYARESASMIVVLGGNQHDRIMFTSYALKGATEFLRFFVPSAYAKQAAEDAKKNDLETHSAADLNKAFEIDLSGIPTHGKQKTT